MLPTSHGLFNSILTSTLWLRTRAWEVQGLVQVPWSLCSRASVPTGMAWAFLAPSGLCCLLPTVPRMLGLFMGLREVET